MFNKPWIFLSRLNDSAINQSQALVQSYTPDSVRRTFLRHWCNLIHHVRSQGHSAPSQGHGSNCIHPHECFSLITATTVIPNGKIEFPSAPSTRCGFRWTTSMFVRSIKIAACLNILEHSTTLVNNVRQCWTDVHTVRFLLTNICRHKSTNLVQQMSQV